MSNDVPIGEYPQTPEFDKAAAKLETAIANLNKKMERSERLIKQLVKENNEFRKMLGLKLVEDIVTSDDQIKTVTHEDWRKSNGY
jgi:predicted RNase H-like nuclease (RuvC/YqgF family)